MARQSRSDVTAAQVVASDFNAFYSAHLTRRQGERIRSTALLAGYQAWADQHGRGSIHHRELRRLMADHGHRLMRTDGMKYLDVAQRHEA